MPLHMTMVRMARMGWAMSIMAMMTTITPRARLYARRDGTLRHSWANHQDDA